MTDRKKPSIPFVSFHGHSTVGSINDALGYPDEHIEYGYNNGLLGMAFTDHGNCNGHSYAFLKSQKMKKEGKTDFRVLYGIEAYVHPSIASWREQKERYAADQKLAKEIDTDEQLNTEDESETKKGIRNPLNKRGHLVLVAQNNVGLKNIFKLTTQSYTGDNFYRFPRMDFDMLKKHNEGIIATGACIGSIGALPYWENKEKGDSVILGAMEETYGNLLDIFGDRFYGELQWANNTDQHRINQFIIQLSKQLGFQLVSTVDSHYPSPDKWKDREIYKMLGWMNKKDDTGINALPNTLDEMQYQLYPKNGDELFASYREAAKQQGFQYDDNLIRESIERTADILKNRIENFEIDTSIKLPSFVVPDGETADSALVKLAIQGIKDRGLHIHKEYVDRLKHEIKFVKDKKFSQYFLATKSIVNLADDKMLRGISRGSASGSLLAYCLGITQIDSVKYKLPFERFLNNAGGFPDIDLDFSDNDKMKNLAVENFGKENVAFISNYNTLQLKSLIKDISKLYGITFQEVNEVTAKMLEEADAPAKKKNGIAAGVYDPTYEELKEFSPTFNLFLNKYPQVGENITNLLDNVRNHATHAAGILVADKLTENMPLVVRNGIYQTPWAEGQSVRHLEPFGFIKFDLLGLKTLVLFEKCIANILKTQGVENPTFEEISKFYNENMSVEKIDFDDQKVYENVFHNPKWTGGIFQFTQIGVQRFCNEVKPTNIDELSAITSIFRPGPLSSKVDRQYVEAKQNPESIVYDHPIIEEVLKKNYGLLVYQEDISTITHRLGKDISPDEGQEFRKVLTKKGLGGKEVEVKERIKGKFLAGCIEKGLSEDKAKELYKKMEYFAQYSFSKNHSLPYCMTSFQCAWLWTYYPDQWMAAYLDFVNIKLKESAISIAKSFGYSIRKLDINKSGINWEVSKDEVKTLIQPLSSIKGLGEAAIGEIMKYRPFSKIEDLLFHDKMIYSKVNKKSLDSLTRGGALNNMVDSRFTGLKHFWSACVVDRPKTKKKFEENIPKYAPEGDFSVEEKIEHTVSLIGSYPVNDVVEATLLTKLEQKGILPISEFVKDETQFVWFIPRKIENKKTKNGKAYQVATVTDSTGTLIDIKCWGDPKRESFLLNRAYMGKLNHEGSWGFSVRSFKEQIKLLG